jgi:hypothetical protein
MIVLTPKFEKILREFGRFFWHQQIENSEGEVRIDDF